MCTSNEILGTDLSPYDENKYAESKIEKLIDDGVIEKQNILILDKNFEDQFPSKDIIVSMRKLAEKYSFEFKLTEDDLETQRKNITVDKILKKTLRTNYDKLKLSRELANKIDLNNLDKNPFAEYVVRILNM